MAEKLTPQQLMAVKNRGGKLLVSAAAGSGKTKVLVDRLMDYVLDPVDPANLDDFLIITYTKAAASELRGKISAKLSEKLAVDPDNKHLQRQMQRLYLAKISTVHAFCGDILRQYAYHLQLSGDFRVADENECAQLREMVMTRMLEGAYDSAEHDPDFRAFVDAQGLGRDDRLVPEILLKVYDSARCHLDPEKWLDECVANAQVEGLSDAGQTIWGKYLMQDLFAYLDLQIDAMGKCAELATQAEGMEKPAALLSSTVAQLKFLHDSSTWDDILQRKNIDYGRLTFSKKCPDLDLAEQIKAVRTACKKGVDKKLKSFADPSFIVLADMAQTAGAVRGIVSLVRRFGAEFDRAKKSRRILDFGDLEHRTLDLLLGKSRGGVTAAAKEIGKGFREIMVDEYQDSNAVQDAIFDALTRERNNCFMVGDVKQSIYQFRLADPGIFLHKYNTFAEAEDAADGEGRRVLLSANFRSGGAVLKSVNDVFALCMSPNVGGLRYGDEEALKEGIPHEPLGEAEVELYAIDVQESTYEEEAAFVANRINQLIDGSHYVRKGDQLRPIVPEDVAILLRSPGSVGRYFIDALAGFGIRCASGGGLDLLQTQEVSVLRSILQTISNPRQDIPLIATLASPVFGFTADDLAAFRCLDRKSSVYEALLKSRSPMVKEFLDVLAILRREARLKTLAQLIETIFNLTQMDSIYAAMDGGKVRKENLYAFYQYAADYEGSARHDLEQFLEHLQAMEEKGLNTGSEQNASGCVTLMSIHKSKGLEFPVVFVCGLSREFNRESARAQVLCDQQLGLGLSAVDAYNRLRYPTIAKRAIVGKVMSDGLSEELRVLYVALTRARDRLIMTYASNSLQKDLTEIAARMDLSRPELLTRDVVCPGEWVLMTALGRTEAGKLHNLGGRPQNTKIGDPVWKIDVVTAVASASQGQIQEETVKKLPAEDEDRIRRGITYRYPYLKATQTPSKQTATQRKGRLKDEEVAENTQPTAYYVRKWRQPSFVAAQLSGADRGTAMHQVMQFIDFDKCRDELSVQQEVWRLVDEGLITDEQARLVNVRQIASIFESELGNLLRSDNEVVREFKFSMLDDASNYDPSLAGEKILLQGVVDCAVIAPDGITIIDFKTDRVSEETLGDKARYYRPQVMAYVDAMEKIYQKPVKSAVLYFFGMAQTVQMLES